MDIRIAYSTAFTSLVISLSICAVLAYRSPRSIGKSVTMLCTALIPPLLGNLIIVGASVEARSVIGYYTYFLGMDLVMLALVHFTNAYCQGIGDGKQKPTLIYAILGLDAVQMLLNPVFHHAFCVEPVMVDEKLYFRLVPLIGQTIHRVVDYSIFFAVILIFLIRSVRSAKLYRERYTVLLMTMLAVGLWQTFYILSRKPIDRSMIGYGFFGVIVFYFSIYYRPLRLLDRMLSGIAAEIPEAMFVFDPTCRCIWANAPGQRLTGTDEKHLEQVTERLTQMFGESKRNESDWTESRVIGSGESAQYYALEHHSVNDDKNILAGSFLFVRDTTEEQRRIKNEIYSSTHDSLTDLYTKQYLYTCIRSMLTANPSIEYLAIFADVKNFKIVNDVFSSEFGDLALQQIADWIRDDMDEKCVYGRLGGDTFGVFIPKPLFDADSIAAELMNFTVTDGVFTHHLLIHLGVYEVKDPTIDVSVMFDRAHMALTTIKDDYKTHIAYYDSNLREKILWGQKITTMLDDALREMQIRPYLQPITDATGKVVGAEALARWIHPEHGFLSPGVFIPVFEKNGMIVEVDRHMWRCACKILADWKGVHDDLFISVNISPKDFYFFDVVAEIKALVQEYQIDPIKLRIEITETVMMNDAEDRMAILDEFRRSGFIVEMDDFGSGYSSLNLLKDMPVDVLKVDMKFLSGSEGGSKSNTILRSIMQLAEDLGIASLTEGVETEQQFRDLSAMGCRLFQGYYFAKPMPLEEFEQFAFK